MKEILVSGKHYRVLADSVNNIWHRISYWTKASDVEFDDGTRLEGKVFGHAILAREKEYVVGDIAYCTNAPSWVQLQCIEAGKTATTEPPEYSQIQDNTNYGIGLMIKDGTATFVVFDIRPTQEESDSEFQAPSVGLLKRMFNKAVDTAADRNNTRLYVGEDNKLHFTDKAGADSALNFKLHDATYTFDANSTGSVVDLGTRHKYRYVNAQNVYSKGLTEGISEGTENVKKITYKYHHHTVDDTNNDNDNKLDCPYADDYQMASPSGCFTTPYYHIVDKRSHTERYASGMHLVDGHWECDTCGKWFGDTGHSTTPDGQCWHERTVIDANIDYWTTDATKTPRVATKYICSCGKTNGAIMSQSIEFN